MSFFRDCDPLSVKEIVANGRVVWNRVSYLIDGLRDLPETERVEILSHFCSQCGDYDPAHKCVCMRDE